MYQSSGEASRCAAGSEYHNTRADGSRDGELRDAGRGGVWGVMADYGHSLRARRTSAMVRNLTSKQEAQTTRTD